MKKTEICKKIISLITSYINSPDCLEAHRVHKHFTRKRKISFKQVVIYLLYSSKASMFQNLATILDDFVKNRFLECQSKLYQRLEQASFHRCFKNSLICQLIFFFFNIGKRKTWHDKHVFAIDGSKLQLPNSKSNFEEFSEMFSAHNHDRKFSMALASMVYDVLEDYIVHASINPYLTSERQAAVNHLKTIENLGIYDNSVIVFDRGYYSEWLFRYCVSHSHPCVMRLKEKINISKASHGDTITILPGNAKERTEDIRIRVIDVPLESGETEYLATNIFDDDYTAKMFKDLYFLRWSVESKYYELKYRVNLEEFNGATSNSIKQELFINMLISNLSALIKNDADETIDKTANSTNKYRYQANRTFIIGRIKRVFPRILAGVCMLSSVDRIIDEALKRKSQIQPGRKQKRPRIERKSKHFRHNKVTV
ncbi:MAG: IS4 family transposase [Lachnospiraceae bacterium]|nr:IS4 family transposase [Lachnospiraceae bacterium]